MYQVFSRYNEIVYVIYCVYQKDKAVLGTTKRSEEVVLEKLH